MPRTNRDTLKEYFRQGNMPDERHFRELIDSTLNIADDGINKTPDDGLRLAPMKDGGPVVSVFKNIQETESAWSVSLDNLGCLHIKQKNATQPVVSFYPDGRVELNKAGCNVHINGPISAQRFDGTIQGDVPANGQWHNIDLPEDIPVRGCCAYRIMAGCGKRLCGQYALLEATAMHCYGKHRKIRNTQSWFGSYFNKIKLRWYGEGQHCQLQIRTNHDYGPDIYIHYQLTDLWGDPVMDCSDKRKNVEKE